MAIRLRPAPARLISPRTLGGHLTFHFTSGGSFDAGDWHYQSPNNVPNNSLETFHYVIADGDGDQAGADLSITVTSNDAPHANFDMVLTNFDGVAFNVPEWAFLHNDLGSERYANRCLPACSISMASRFRIRAGAGTNGFITIDDEDTANGGSFDYTISNGTLSDTASVSVSNLNGGGNITGTALPKFWSAMATAIPSMVRAVATSFSPVPATIP